MSLSDRSSLILIGDCRIRAVWFWHELVGSEQTEIVWRNGGSKFSALMTHLLQSPGGFWFKARRKVTLRQSSGYSDWWQGKARRWCIHESAETCSEVGKATCCQACAKYQAYAQHKTRRWNGDVPTLTDARTNIYSCAHKYAKVHTKAHTHARTHMQRYARKFSR